MRKDQKQICASSLYAARLLPAPAQRYCSVSQITYQRPCANLDASNGGVLFSAAPPLCCAERPCLWGHGRLSLLFSSSFLRPSRPPRRTAAHPKRTRKARRRPKAIGFPHSRAAEPQIVKLFQEHYTRERDPRRGGTWSPRRPVRCSGFRAMFRSRHLKNSFDPFSMDTNARPRNPQHSA